MIATADRDAWSLRIRRKNRQIWFAWNVDNGVGGRSRRQCEFARGDPGHDFDARVGSQDCRSTEAIAMARFNTILAVIIFSVGAFVSQSALAQYLAGSYTPQTPLISPWMGLWGRNTGPLDNYHNSVLPQMELDATLQQQNAALRRQSGRLQDFHNEVQQSQMSPSGMAPTGQGATFMNYSHYYGGSRQITHAPRPAAAKTSNLPALPGAR